MDPTKIEATTSWSRPSTVSEARSFLGLAGYYWRFVEDYFSRIATPLTQLTRKGTHFVSSATCESIQNLKQKLVTAPLLQCQMDLVVL